MQDNKQACQLAETALQEAMNKIDDVDEETFRDAKSIIELLKENLTLWKEEEGGDNNIEDLWTYVPLSKSFNLDYYIIPISYLLLIYINAIFYFHI